MAIMKRKRGVNSMKNPFVSFLNYIAKHFKDDPANMLIITGIVGWSISSLAQISAIVLNSKLSKEQKSFLIPQEFADAAVNIGSFFAITRFSKSLISKMFQTGKIAPKKVRNYLNENKNIYGDKIGKLDFNLDDILRSDSKFPKAEYEACKNLYTTATTVGAGILATNIVTPIVRNKMASRMHNVYIDNKEAFEAGDMKIAQTYPKSSGMKI